MAEYVMPRIHFRKGAAGRPLPMNPIHHYDSVSDTYFIFFYGAMEPSISVDVTDTMYALLDPESDDLIGIQIEAFIRTYLPQHPWLGPFTAVLTSPSKPANEEEHNQHRGLASYFVGSLMTEGSLATP